MTKIAWTNETWNPVTGCTKISPGCANCYAEAMSRRLQGMGLGKYAAGFAVAFHPECLDEPLHWKKPRRVFVCSMSDFLHEDISPERWTKIQDAIAAAPQHIYQLLTKRSGRLSMFAEHWTRRTTDRLPSNWWFGVTVEDQQRANERIPDLLNTPAAVRFVSVEPMLGPVKLNLATRCDRQCHEYIYAECPGTSGLCIMQRALDQVIVGCESGPKRRPCKIEWVRDLRDQCTAADVPFFVKQLDIGGKVVHDLDQFPPDLRIRQYPKEQP